MSKNLCVQLVPLFKNLNINKQTEIEELLHHKTVLKGEIIAAPNKANYLAILEHGTAKLYQLNIDGNEQIIRTLATGDYIGQNWLLGIENINQFVETTTDSGICILNRKDFLNLLRQDSDIAVKILAEQAHIIDHLHKQNQLMGLPSIEEKVTTYLSLLSSEQNTPNITLPLKLKDLASYLGTTPETLTRILRKLEVDGLIKRHLREIKLLQSI